jgi:queuine tRNA-ribosyltransferase
MALDDVVGADTADGARFAQATARTMRWIDRCVAAHGRPAEQSLFGIAQGGLDVAPGGLRERCLAGLLARADALPGLAIGGLAGGEAKDAFWRVVDHAAARLPARKPRYLMGVGYPLDIVVCSALGVDMYDCVYPTRTGRFGTALVHAGLLKLRAAAYAADARPIDATCACHVCASYTRAHLHAMLRAREPAANVAQLVTHHNIAYMMRLVREMRRAIIAGTYGHYLRAFVHSMFPRPADIPAWVLDAAHAAGIDARTNTDHAPTLALFSGTPAADSVPSADRAPADDDTHAAGGAAQPPPMVPPTKRRASQPE